MSAAGDFYIRACELAGLDIDAAASVNKVAAACDIASLCETDAVNHDPAYRSTAGALLSTVVAILKGGAR